MNFSENNMKNFWWNEQQSMCHFNTTTIKDNENGVYRKFSDIVIV